MSIEQVTRIEQLSWNNKFDDISQKSGRLPKKYYFFQIALELRKTALALRYASLFACALRPFKAMCFKKQ